MIRNTTRGTVICRSKATLTSILAKAKGLMFSRKIIDKGLVFVFNKPTIVDLHMFFVFFPIDVVFLDSRRAVLEIKENFLPFTLYVSRHKARYIIELPCGAVRESRTEVGDILEF